MEKENQTFNFQNLIIAMYVLKVKFDFSKKISGLLIFMSNLQPLCFIFELQNTNLASTLTLRMEKLDNHSNTYIYQILEILFRPSIKLIFIFGNYVEYAFFIVTFLILIHKIGLIIFTQYYFIQEKSQKFIKLAENSFFPKLFCYYLNIYQQLVGSYLFLEMNFICLTCLSKQLEQLENYGFLLVTLNILTMILLIIDSIGTIIINESTITNKVYGLEKLGITIYRYIYYVFIIIQSIIVIEFDQLHVEYILSAILLCQQLILILDLFIHFNYILHYQKYSLIIAISINLSISLSIFIVSTFNAQLLKLCCLIIFSLILKILLNLDQKNEKKQMLELFKTSKTNLNYLRFGLIFILNNEIYFQQEDLIIKILIAKWHTSRCKSKLCTFCSHISIQNPEQCCGITNEMYKQFVQQMISCFLQKSTANNNRSNQRDYSLLYAYFLFDFGWIIRSIKILDHLFQNKQPYQQPYYQQQIQSPSKYKFQENQLQLNDNNFDQYGLQKINNFQQLDYITKVQMKFIVQCGKSQISSSLIGSSLQATQQSMIQEFIEKSLKSESLIRYLERKVMETLMLKLKLYHNLKNTCTQSQDEINFNKQLYQLCEQVYEVNKLLKFQFKNTPNQKIHGLYTFFQGEILSNYYKSILFYKNSKSLEVELNKFQQIINFNINQKNVHFAILELCDDMQNLTLIGQSQNFYDNYGSNNEKQRSFEYLLPDFLIPYHNLYVKQFFENGTSKYYNAFQINFIMNNQHILTTVNMCHSMTNLFKSKNITFAVFLQEATQDKAFLVIDGTNMKCIFTKNLLILIGWSESEIKYLSALKEFNQVEISSIYPNFTTVIMEHQENEIKLSSVNMYFPSPQSSFESIQCEIKISPDKARQNLRLYNIECDIIIQRKQIGNYCYFILDIIKMAEFNRGRELSQIHQRLSLNSIKQNESLNQPLFLDCIVDQQDDSPHIGNLNSVNFINQQQIGSIQNISKPLLFQVNPIIFVNNSPVLNSRREETINQSEQQLITQRNSLIKQDIKSPSFINQQSIQSIDDKENSQFKSPILRLKESSDEQDKIHQNYELLQQILSISPSRYQKKFMVLFSIWFLLFIIFIIVQYIELKNDLDDLLSFGFMTSFYASIMGPHDLFFSMRVTITGYQQMNREGFLASNQLFQLTEPYYESIQLGYTELRDSLYDQLDNQYIKSFLDDVKVTMNFMNKNEEEIYAVEISFRDALFIILQYQHAQMITFNHRGSTSGQPYQISLFANYFMLHKECESLKISMYDYAIQMHKNMNYKLIILWIAFDLALIIFYIYLQFFQIEFFQQLDKFIQLIFLIDEPILNNEIQRFNDLIDSIKLNSNILFMYNPEHQLQQHLKKPLHSQKHQNQNQKYKQNFSAINKTRSLIKIFNIAFLIFLLSIILIFSLLSITSTQLFFNKYDDTLKLYEKIQEMKLRSGNLFLYREIFFRWENFTFLTENNKLELYDLIDKAQNAISNYIQISNTINFDYYLIDQNFIDLFNNINRNTLCQQIDEKFKNLSSVYCGLSFDGSFAKGMIVTLNYMSNLIKSQQEINNFTHRVEMQYYEQEGSQIVSRIFFVLVNQFNKSLKEQFDDLKLFLTVLSLSFGLLTISIQGLLFYYYSPYLGRIMKIIKRVVHLIPFESLMNNEILERQLKELKFRFQ